MSQRKNLWKPLLLAGALILCMVLARVFNLGGRFGDLRAWILSFGALGPVVYLVIYIAAVVLAVPGSVISIMAGVLFGSFYGTVLVSVGSTIGASLAFLIARHVARESIALKFAHNQKYIRLEQLTKEHGAIIVAITRLVPLFPFNLLNYGFGLTQVPFRTYVFWSWLCMLPGTVLYVVGADTLTLAVSQGKIPWLLIIILAVTIVIIILLVRQAKNKIGGKDDESKNS
jgi:uncharacterized membrane protein YdjX (TVP38/TMEM64 family)